MDESYARFCEENGNVIVDKVLDWFYEQGIQVLTDPRYLYHWVSKGVLIEGDPSYLMLFTGSKNIVHSQSYRMFKFLKYW